MRPKLHKIVVDPSKPEDSLRDLQGFQDRVHQALTKGRLSVGARPSAEPIEGELLYADKRLQLAVMGKYKVEYVTIYPLDLSSLGLPQWFLARLRQRETELRDAGIPEKEWPGIGGL